MCNVRIQVLIALMMEAARTSETSVDIDLRTRQHIPEDSELYMCNVSFQITTLVLTVFAACILLTLAAPPNFNDQKNNEGKVSMRFFPGAGSLGPYPGAYPGGFPGGYPGAFPGVYPGIYPGGYGGPSGFGYPPFGYPSFGYPGAPVMFYSNKDGNNPARRNAAPGEKH
jgi:hypothetical protein